MINVMIKVIFLDLDGTMLPFGGHAASPATLVALRAAKEAGYLLYVSTGRHLPNIQGLDSIDFDGYITLNGQYCVSQGKLIRSNHILRDDIRRLLKYIDQNPFSCAFIQEDKAYVNQGGERYERVSRFINLNMSVSPDFRQAAENDILQCLFFLSEEQQDKPLSELKKVEYTRWHPDFIDVVPLGGGKGIGVEAILKHLGIGAEHALCIGDGENDISMMEIAGTAVAMGQSSDKVKSYADFVTEDVAGDGVWHTFRHYGIISGE